MRLRIDVLLFIILLFLAVALWTRSSMDGSSFGYPASCADIEVSYMSHGFSYSLDKPFFTAQDVLTPGSLAYLDVHYTTTRFDPTFNLTSSLLNPFQGSEYRPTIRDVFRVNLANGQFTWARPVDVGLTISLLNMSFSGSEAVLQYSVSADRSSLPATYLLGIPDYCSPLFLTVGYLPYLGPLPQSGPQPITLVLYLLVAVLIGGCVHLFLRHRYS